ncbi:MAG: pyruvate kinase [Myxococcales bacterium]|nr:MAG: pyruvate kinase [Myxococcales bacterium]
MKLPPQQSQTRLTKIVCTIGPSTRSWDTLAALARAGMNLARLNMSHGDHASHLQVIRNLKSLSKKLPHPVSILMDLQGPEIRTGELAESLDLNSGDVFYFSVLADDAEERSVHVNYLDLVNDLRVGERVTVDNGLINLEVLEISEHRLKCRVLDGGTLGSRKHVNLPGVRVNLPSITNKDREDIQFAIEQDVDFIALSFVRGVQDVREVREIVNAAGGHQRLIAKIENQEGIDNFDEILEAADGIMVARGDLGVEVAFEELPVLQRDMIRRCAIAGKPIIVATHLLESMIDNPLPTRAEVTDVANAVYEQADAIMLSGETAAGKYPVRCVEVLDTIARRIEMGPGLDFYKERPPPETQRAHIAQGACRLADSLDAKAIVVMTRRGYFGQLVASYRPQRAIIYAFTNMSTTRRKLWLNRSVIPFRMNLSSDPEKTIVNALSKLRERDVIATGEPVVVVSDVATATGDLVTSIQVRVSE